MLNVCVCEREGEHEMLGGWVGRGILRLTVLHLLETSVIQCFFSPLCLPTSHTVCHKTERNKGEGRGGGMESPSY